MEDLLERLEDQSGMVESKLNKFSGLKDEYAKENAYNDLNSLMQRFKSTVRIYNY